MSTAPAPATSPIPGFHCPSTPDPVPPAPLRAAPDGIALQEPVEAGAAELLRSALPEPGRGELDALRARLARRAHDDGLLDVAYRTIDSPHGRLLLAVAPAGLVRVAFESEGLEAVLDELARSVSPRLLEAASPTDGAARQLDEYFEGRRRAFDLPIDLRLVRGFRREVVEHLRTIPYGSTRSYSEVARGAGRPTAVRAAGSACATNPIPIVVPCHRVVRSDGTVGQYLGGAPMKSALLALESA
jgi:methylated-DNA-[protein]-cysteine S-methyltransferase